MTLIQRSGCYASAIGLALAVANAQGADMINGYNVNARVYNDMPGSTLVITPPALPSNPATFNVRDQFVGAGVNRHDFLASGDFGTTAHVFGIDDSFIFSTRLTLTDGFNSPRKEAGIRINSPITGDALFIINSDAGEIVAFGGGAPFYIFGKNATGNGYTPGTSILMGIKEVGGGDGSGGTANTLEYFIDRGAGIETSGPLAWSNIELGPLNYTAGVYVQGGNAGNGDFINGSFVNTTFTTVPEPGTFAMIGMGLFGLWAIRRKR